MLHGEGWAQLSPCCFWSCPGRSHQSRCPHQCELTCLLAREATEGRVEFCEATVEAECLSPALRTIGCPFSEQVLYFKGALAMLSLLGPSHTGSL